MAESVWYVGDHKVRVAWDFMGAVVEVDGQVASVWSGMPVASIWRIPREFEFPLGGQTACLRWGRFRITPSLEVSGVRVPKSMSRFPF